MELDEKEAKELQARLEAVARWYPISATQKAIDHAALVGAIGFIYAPRAFAINRRLKRERGQAPPVPPRTATPAAPNSGMTPPAIVLPSQFGRSVDFDGNVH